VRRKKIEHFCDNNRVKAIKHIIFFELYKVPLLLHLNNNTTYDKCVSDGSDNYEVILMTNINENRKKKERVGSIIIIVVVE
jgi:hypothetical protein